jgi:hypothetical protein
VHVRHVLDDGICEAHAIDRQDSVGLTVEVHGMTVHLTPGTWPPFQR